MSDNESPTVLRHISGYYATIVLAIAERSGLLDALEVQPGTAADLAERCGLDERNVLEALRALVASEVVTFDGGVFSLADETRAVLDPSFPMGIRAGLRVLGGFTPLVAETVTAMRSGAGIEVARFVEVGGEGFESMGGIGLPMYEQALCADWLAGTPAIAAKLEAGADVADIGSGFGATVVLVAEAFPTARVQGWEPRPTDRTDLPSNASLHAGYLADVPSASFDVALVLDTFHHLGDPTENAAHLHRILRPGGVVLVVEDIATGDLKIDAENPLSVIGYGSRLTYCLQENLAAGGGGLMVSDGTGWVNDALASAGFTEVSERDTAYGTRLITAIA